MEKKTILITGATDGIGLETARQLIKLGHRVMIHGRSRTKLESVAGELGVKDIFKADLSDLSRVNTLADEVISGGRTPDVLINNAGVFMAPETRTKKALDLRFVVNTIAPYLLTKRLVSSMDASGRVVNLSSAAQSPVSIEALNGQGGLLHDGSAYAMSKLALTMWSRQLGLELKNSGPLVVSVNPGSMLGSKMVKQAYGVQGGDLAIGADILCRAALGEEFADAAGMYFDNDRGTFASPHPDALDESLCREVVNTLEKLIKQNNTGESR